MVELFDKVRVKLHEPVGNATTETANKYLNPYVDKIGTVIAVSDKNEKKIKWYRVMFEDPHNPSWARSGVFRDYELEKVNGRN